MDKQAPDSTDSADKPTRSQAATVPTPRRHPSRIPKLVERKDAQIVRQAHVSYYGFDISDQWANDLAKFVDKPGAMPQMLASGDPEQVREEIRSVYGVDVSTDYARDLIAFAQQVTKAD